MTILEDSYISDGYDVRIRHGYRIDDAQAVCAGAAAGECVETGAVAGQAYHSGALKGQIHG
jgi:hypothetical protein